MEKITYQEVINILSDVRQRAINTIKEQLEIGKKHRLDDEVVFTEAIDTDSTKDWLLMFFTADGVQLVDLYTNQAERFEKWEDVNNFFIYTILEKLENDEFF